MDLTIILIVLILGLDFVISLWNSYNSGFMFGKARKSQGRAADFMLIYSIFGLIVGFAGTIYVITIALGAGLAYFGYIAYGVLDSLLALNFLVFGGVITFFGIGVTVMGIYNAYKTKNKWMALISVWNVFATIMNLYVYISNFGPAVGILKTQLKSGKKDTGTLIIVAAIGIVIGALIAYAFYTAGRRKAERVQ